MTNWTTKQKEWIKIAEDIGAMRQVMTDALAVRFAKALQDNQENRNLLLQENGYPHIKETT